MIEKLIRYSVNNKAVIGMFVLALIAAGIYSLVNISIDAVPDITNNQVQIVTVSPSLAPQEVEQFLTYPIEMTMANLQSVVEIRSISRYGLSVVTLVFEENFPTLDARQLVNERLQIAANEIPESLGKPEMMPITTGLGEIFQYTLEIEEGYEDRYTATDLRTIHDWIVKRQLAGTPGIVEVSSFGGFLKQYEVALDPDRMKNYDITIAEVFSSLEKNNGNTGGSYIQKGPYAYYIRAEGMLKEIKDIESILVKNIQGYPILIKDIADVQIGHAPRFGAMTKDGKGEAVGGITLMLKGANAHEVTKNVREKMKEVEKSLPKGLSLKPYLDRSELIDRVVATVSKNLIEGGLIVIFILVLLLGNLRAGLIIASIIPLSMLFALAMMKLMGVSANLMSLGAIDFGLIVDSTVIIVESVVHHIQRRFPGIRLNQKQMDEEVTKSTIGIQRAALFGAIIILIVFLPILTLVGIEGKMFRPMAMTVSFAIVGALLLSFTYVPVVSSIFLKKKHIEKRTIDKQIMGFLEKLYKPTISFALVHRWLVISGSVILLVGSVFIFTRLGAEFIPDLEEGDLAMQMTIPPGSSLNESIKTSTRAEKILLDNFPEVKSVVSKIGTAEVPTDPMAVEDGDIMIILKPKRDWTSAKDRHELADLMKEKLSVIPGASFEFTQPIQLRFNELMTGAKSDVAVKIFGEDLDILSKSAKHAAHLIEDIPGASDIKVEQVEGFPQLMIRYDREKLSHLGLHVEDLNTTVRTALSGESAGFIFEGEKKFDLVVRLNEENRSNIEKFKNLYINTGLGLQVPVGAVASIEFMEGPMQISREETKRRITVGINIRNRDVQSVVDDIKTKLEAELNLPPGYQIKYGGQFENLQAAEERGQIAVPISLLLILILLYFMFKSLRQALMIYSAIPLAAIGGILALWTRGMPFSISAGVGFIALFGVAVLDGIVLLSYFNELRDEGIGDISDRAKLGATRRLRPVIMTSAVASLGFLPMALSTSAGAEVQRPLATVVIGGLISATFLTLVVLPVIYVMFSKIKKVKLPKAAVLVLLLPLLSFPAMSQTEITTSPINLETALRVAHKNNPMLKNAALEIEKARQQKAGSWKFDPVELNYQKGQINSSFQDQNFSINQNLGSPWHSISKGKYYNELINQKEIRAVLTGKELDRQLTSVFYSWIWLRGKMDVLESYQAKCKKSQEVSEKKYELGEANLLSKLYSEVRYRNVESTVSEISIQLKDTENEFRFLLNSTENFVPVFSPLQRYSPLNPDSISAPIIFERLFDSELILAERETNLAKSQIGPSLSAGYFNQQIDQVKGFTGYEVGLSFPLLFFGQVKEINSARVDEAIARNKIVRERDRFRNELANLKFQLQEKEKQLQFYDNEGLGLVELIMEKAGILYGNGEISYLEYLNNMEEATQLQLNYFDVLNNINQIEIRIEYLQAKN